ADAAPLLPALATGLTATLEPPPAPPPLDAVPDVDPPVLDVCAVAGAATSSTPLAATAASRQAIVEPFRTTTFVAHPATLSGRRALRASPLLPEHELARCPPAGRSAVATA